MEGALQAALPPLVCNTSFIGTDNNSASPLSETKPLVYPAVYRIGSCRAMDGEKADWLDKEGEVTVGYSDVIASEAKQSKNRSA